MIMGDILQRNARLYPDQAAVLFEGRVTTHAAFLDRVQRLAAGLRKLGLRRQQRIAILAQNCTEYLEIYGVCEEAGFIGVGLNYRLSDPELVEILRDAQPSVIFFGAEYEARVGQIQRDLAQGIPVIRVGASPSSALDYERLLQEAVTEPDAARAAEDDTVYLFYTSGTTGRPKGAMLGNGGQAQQAEIYGDSAHACPSDRMLIVMPLFHCGGKLLQVMYISKGATIVLHRSFDAKRIFDSLVDDRVTAAHLAPVMIQEIVARLDAEPRKFPLLRTIHYASAPMSVALLRRAVQHFGLVLTQLYGMTENGAGTHLAKADHVMDGPEEQVARLASAGKPFKGTELMVVDDHETPCRTGQIGEVLTRAPGLMSGYWNNPAASSEALRGGWMHTGDLGYLDEDGFLFIVDRKKDMIISGGENIYCREVEEALANHPAVLEAAVVGVPDQKWGEAVKAFVVLRTGATTTESGLIAHVRQQIGSYKKPKSIEFVAVLPRLSSTNKVDKKALRAPYWNEQSRQVA